MGDTEISWTHRPGTVGRTWNPVQGCRRISPGCEHCYAERLAARFAEKGWSQGLINLKTRKWNGEARLAAHKLDEPLRWRQPATVFVNSMSDLFYERFTNEEIAAVFGVMAAAPQHTFQVLTKRAKRMHEWFEWLAAQRTPLITIPHSPRLTCRCEAERVLEQAGIARHLGSEPQPRQWPLPNVWLGVSVENQAAADERIPELMRTPAAVRFLSCEPLIGPVDLRPFLGCPECGYTRRDVAEQLDHHLCKGPGPLLRWTIAGCESGPGARPCEVAWLRSLRDQCAAARVDFFLKQAVETDLGICDNDDSCGERIVASVVSERTAMYSCGCTIEGGEDGSPPPVAFGDDAERGAGRVLQRPYLDGVQHLAFPEVRS